MTEIFVAVWQDAKGTVHLLNSAPESADIREWVNSNFPDGFTEHRMMSGITGKLKQSRSCNVRFKE